MAYYVPTPRSEHNPTHEPHLTHRNNNCTCACAAVALDYETLGKLKVYPGDIRHNQPDQVLGTDLHDMQIAWRKFGHELTISDGTWPNVITALEEGRCVLLPGRSQKLEGMCSQSQATEHCILLHPRGDREKVGANIYTMDPWCAPAKWEYVDRNVLYRYWKALGWNIGVTRGRKP